MKHIAHIGVVVAAGAVLAAVAVADERDAGVPPAPDAAFAAALEGSVEVPPAFTGGRHSDEARRAAKAAAKAAAQAKVTTSEPEPSVSSSPEPHTPPPVVAPAAPATPTPPTSVPAALPAGYTVAIDPGHGGSNLGAPGSVEGVYEKKVTLIVARLIKKRLERDGVKVVLTREADAYLTLGERVRRANAAHAHAFISLHANATPEHKRRGFDAYLLSREVVDIASRKAGTPTEGTSDPTDSVVARARVRQVARQSSQLARSLRERLAKVRSGDRGTRQAPFDVLEGLEMPGVLFEIGFIDHVDEGVELIQPEVMHTIADAIAEGIEAFGAAGAR